jgi:membrane protein DedA with SNARE-associated domain
MDALSILIAQGSLGLIFAVLVVAGLGVPIPEDIPILAAGVLSQQGAAPFWVALIVCMAGVMVGDTIIFLTAQRLGTKALDRPFFAKLLPKARREKIQRLFHRFGGGVIFVARFLPGLRAPTFAFAGMHGMSYKRFAFFDGLALCLSAPWIMGIGYWFAGNTDKIEEYMGGFKNLVYAIVGLVVVVIVVKVLWSRWRAKKNKEAELAAASASPSEPTAPGSA